MLCLHSKRVISCFFSLPHWSTFTLQSVAQEHFFARRLGELSFGEEGSRKVAVRALRLMFGKGYFKASRGATVIMQAAPLHFITIEQTDTPSSLFFKEHP